jgi:hypothetical protein
MLSDVCRQMNEDCARLMGRVGLAAASFTFTLGWDETEFGRVVGWVGEMEGDRRRLLGIFFWDYLDHEDTKASWMPFTNNGDQAAHLLFLLLGPAEDDLALLPNKERDYTFFQLSLHTRLQGRPDWSIMQE